MGRTIIVEDGIEEYGAALAEKNEPIAGLIFGQEISSQKSCVIHLSRTPEPAVDGNEDDIPAAGQEKGAAPKGKPKNGAGDDFDSSAVLDHTTQVWLVRIREC